MENFLLCVFHHFFFKKLEEIGRQSEKQPVISPSNYSMVTKYTINCAVESGTGTASSIAVYKLVHFSMFPGKSPNVLVHN